MTVVTLTSATGRVYDLTSPGTSSPVVAAPDSLVGVTGRASSTGVSVPGRSGVVPGRVRFEPIEATVDFTVLGRGGDAHDAYQEFRRGWSMTAPSVLDVHADHPLGPFSVELFLAQPLPGVAHNMRRVSVAHLSVQVTAPAGLFLSDPWSGEGTVVVTNTGDEVIYPRVVYSGAGGPVVGPSGASFTLPAVVESTVVDLDPRRLRLAGAFPEGVQPGGSGTWVLPEGAVLVWQVAVADPWA